MKRGFTLIELLVVIAIVSLLSSIVFASISTARDEANATKAQVQSKEIKKAIELSRLSENNLPVQIDSTRTVKEIVEDVNPSPIKTVIEEYYGGDIPDIPGTHGNSGYYYIADTNGKAIDSDNIIYFCGLKNGFYPDDSIIFYRDIVEIDWWNDFKTDNDDIDNWLFYIVGRGVLSAAPDISNVFPYQLSTTYVSGRYIDIENESMYYNSIRVTYDNVYNDVNPELNQHPNIYFPRYYDEDTGKSYMYRCSK